MFSGLTVLGGTQGLAGVDAVEELKIQTSTYAAEFGRQPGGQVQIVTRSGTNQVRGSASGSFRDESFDANDWFANEAGLDKGEFGQQLFGARWATPSSCLASVKRDVDGGVGGIEPSSS